MIKEYLAYLKDNPDRYWFKAKLYGWGWTPARWQGWAVLLGFIVLFTLNFYWIDFHSPSASEALLPFLFCTTLLVVLLLVICWKTGERPRWQWGPSEKK
jgi:hypothetical protein